MPRGAISAIWAIGFFALASLPQVWASLFLPSYIANAVLFMLWYDARKRMRK